MAALITAQECRFLFIFFFKRWDICSEIKRQFLRLSPLFFLTILIQVDNGQVQHGKKAIIRGKGRKKMKERKSIAAQAIMCVRGRLTKRAPLK